MRRIFKDGKFKYNQQSRSHKESDKGHEIKRQIQLALVHISRICDRIRKQFMRLRERFFKSVQDVTQDATQAATDQDATQAATNQDATQAATDQDATDHLKFEILHSVLSDARGNKKMISYSTFRQEETSVREVHFLIL